MFGLKKRVNRIWKNAEVAPTLQLCICNSMALNGGVIVVGDLLPVSKGSSQWLIPIHADFLTESSLCELMLLANSTGNQEVLRDDEGYSGLYRLKETDVGPYQTRPGQYFGISWAAGSKYAQAVAATDKQARKLYDKLTCHILPINYSVQSVKNWRHIEAINEAYQEQLAEQRAVYNPLEVI